MTADAYGERHLAFPLRDSDGHAIVVIDISIDSELKSLPKAETKEVMKMLRLLNIAYKEISKDTSEGERTAQLEIQGRWGGGTTRGAYYLGGGYYLGLALKKKSAF